MDASLTMHRGLPVPRTLPESLHAVRPALLVYDAQVGIFSQLPTPAPLTARLLRIVAAARAAGLPHQSEVYQRVASVGTQQVSWGGTTAAPECSLRSDTSKA